MSQAVPTSNVRDEKECGLMSKMAGQCTNIGSKDSIGTAVSKMLIRYMTESIVDWINSGFEGNPSFISNPAGFAINMVDQEIGNFIDTNSDLKFLCSPFSIDIRLALAFKFSPFKRRISCTLSDVIKNSKNAIDTASINGEPIKGFIDGDFSQGGWDAWVTMTQNPQNNVFGAYSEAEAELGIRIGDKKLALSQELGQGKGFLSWRKCTNKSIADREAAGDDITDEERANSANNSGSSQKGTYHYFGSYDSSKENCEVQTPGSTIDSSLSQSLGSGYRQLELADEFDEIVNALVSQLMQKALTSGLRALSGSGQGDSSSYLRGVGTDLEKQQLYQNIQEANAETIPIIQNVINQEIIYKSKYEEMLGVASTTETIFVDALTCYSSKLSSGLNQAKRTKAESEVNEINTILSTQIRSRKTSITLNLNSAETNISNLRNIIFRMQRVETMNDFYLLSKEASQIVNGGTLHNQERIDEAELERTTFTEEMRVLKVEAQNKLRECQIL